jgi:hypothetical protein
MLAAVAEDSDLPHVNEDGTKTHIGMCVHKRPALLAAEQVSRWYPPRRGGFSGGVAAKSPGFE